MIDTPLFGRQTATLLACCGVSAVLGSIHAFSVFIPEWDLLPGATRGRVSFIYSVALISLTLAVLFGHRIFVMLRPPLILSGVAAGTAAGLLLAASTESLVVIYLSYGCLFGASNGIGYGYVLQLSGQAAERNHALAMSLTTASYALGAMLSPPLLLTLIEISGNGSALRASALIIAAVTLAGAWVLGKDGVSFESTPVESFENLSAVFKRLRWLLWLAYGTAVAAGLMVIGHAYAIAGWLGFAKSQMTLAPMVISLGNLTGGCIAGFFAAKLGAQTLLRFLPGLSALGLLLLVIVSQQSPVNAVSETNNASLWLLIAMATLTIIGFCYGAIIALFPVWVFDLYGKELSTRIYGQVFTAWGFAGLLAPTLSGVLFDVSGTYLTAVWVAILLSVGSLLCMQLIVKQNVA